MFVVVSQRRRFGHGLRRAHLCYAHNVLRRPITADSAIMHPHKKILALKGTSSNPPSLGLCSLPSSWTHTADIQYRDEAESQVTRQRLGRCLLEMDLGHDYWHGHRDRRLPLEHRRPDLSPSEGL